jgi:flagellar basal-body rod modification protein FlgD
VSVSAVGGGGSLGYTQGTAPRELGKDEFLQILVSQFKNQNPLEPVKDTEFIAQMAQFSSLEQLHNISRHLEVMQDNLLWSQALSFLGREIEGIDGDGNLVEGIVTGVKFLEGQLVLLIDGEERDLQLITAVKVRWASEEESRLGAEG